MRAFLSWFTSLPSGGVARHHESRKVGASGEQSRGSPRGITEARLWAQKVEQGLKRPSADRSFSHRPVDRASVEWLVGAAGPCCAPSAAAQGRRWRPSVHGNGASGLRGTALDAPPRRCEGSTERESIGKRRPRERQPPPPKGRRRRVRGGLRDTVDRAALHGLRGPSDVPPPPRRCPCGRRQRPCGAGSGPAEPSAERRLIHLAGWVRATARARREAQTALMDLAPIGCPHRLEDEPRPSCAMGTSP